MLAGRAIRGQRDDGFSYARRETRLEESRDSDHSWRGTRHEYAADGWDDARGSDLSCAGGRAETLGWDGDRSSARKDGAASSRGTGNSNLHCQWARAVS